MQPNGCQDMGADQVMDRLQRRRASANMIKRDPEKIERIMANEPKS